MRRRPCLRLLAAALVVVAPAGCGVAGDDRPRRLATAQVPYGLLEEAPPTTATSAPDAAVVPVSVFFVRDERLVAVTRGVTDPATVGKAVDTLLDGVREDEADAGLRSAINPRTRLLAARLEDDGVARVNLSAAFAGSVQQQIPSLAQIIFTATAIHGVRAVRFTIEGEPVEVPTPDGNVAVGPLGRDAFAALAPGVG